MPETGVLLVGLEAFEPSVGELWLPVRLPAAPAPPLVGVGAVWVPLRLPNPSPPPPSELLLLDVRPGKGLLRAVPLRPPDPNVGLIVVEELFTCTPGAVMTSLLELVDVTDVMLDVLVSGNGAPMRAADVVAAKVAGAPSSAVDDDAFGSSQTP